MVRFLQRLWALAMLFAALCFFRPASADDNATNPLDPGSSAPAPSNSGEQNPLDPNSNPSSPPPPANQNPLNPAAPKAAPANPDSQMRFETYVLQDDPRGIGGEVGRWLIPAGWKVDGGMTWDFSCVLPAQVNIRIYDPNSVAAFAAYPALYFYWSANNGVFPQGTKYGGELVEPPVKDQFEALNKVVIPQFRKDLAHAHVIETEKLPKLAQLVYKALPPGPNAQGTVMAGRERFEYEVKGKKVVEDFYVVYRLNVNPRLHIESWAIQNVTSVRGSKGQIDRLREMHDVMLRSSVPNVAWYSDYSKLMIDKFHRETVAALRAGAAAKAQADRAHAVSDAERQQYESYQQNQDDISEARAETTRGETPYTDTDGNRVVLPSEYGRAFSDGNGGYLVTNDPNYDPNGDLSLHSTYTQLQQAPTLPNGN